MAFPLFNKPPKTVFGTSWGRPVTLQVPPCYKANVERPLVFSLNNYGGSGVAGRLNMSEQVSYDDGVFWLEPQGTLDAEGNSFWNASPACCDKHSTGVDDASFLRSLADEVFASGWPIDRKRVWIEGYSNGGFMGHKMCCAHSDVITAAFLVAGAFPTIDGSGCPTVKNVSIIVVHADGDTTVPYLGGLGGSPVSQQFPVTGVCSAMQTAQYWAARNGVTGGLVQYDTIDYATTGNPSGTGAECDRFAYSGAPVDGQVEFWRVNGGFHTLTASQITFAGQKAFAKLKHMPRVS